MVGALERDHEGTMGQQHGGDHAEMEGAGVVGEGVG